MALEIESAFPAEIAALLGGIAVVGKFAGYRGEAVGAAQAGKHLVDGRWTASQDAAQAALLAEPVPIEICTGLFAVYIVVFGYDTAAVHFRENQFLLFLSDLALNVKVVFEVHFASGEKQDLDVDKSFEGLALDIAGGPFREESVRGPLDAVAGYVDIADAGEYVRARRWLWGITTGGEQENATEGEETRQGGLLDYV